MSDYIIRPAKREEWEDAMALAWCTFQKYEAPEYGEKGTKSFLDFISGNLVYQMFLMGEYHLFVACQGRKIIGMISIRSENLISLLFVEDKMHRRGIGRQLVYYAQMYIRENLHRDCCFVNAAPYAIDFYHRLGFEDQGGVQENDGVRYVPMKAMLL